MNRFLFNGLICLTLATLSPVAAQNLETARRNLMPVPDRTVWGTGRLPITKALTVAFAGQTDERLRNYVFRVMRRIEGRTVLEFARDSSVEASNSILLVETGTTGNPVPQLGDDESYDLTITGTQAKIKAATTVGAMRGLETLLQLIEGDEAGFYLPVVTISDKPRFGWRGLLIDVARHFQPVEVIKRNLDAMAAMKMNVLHWHLTEDQGFRVESRKFPELHTLGSDGLFYTQDEIREIIRYAVDRGIRVVPEFDMPGHATAWLVSHPEIASGPGPYKIERQPGVFDPTLDPTNEKTYKLLEGFFAEMAKLFPDKYLHIGGDENEGKQWNANANIQAFMKEKGIKDNHGLQTYFNTRILKFIQKNGKTMMGWDEIFQPELPKDIVIHSWRGQKALADAARLGFSGILSNGYYIDLMFPASDHYLVDPIPADTALSSEEQKRILGGEATMWSEWVSPDTIDSRIWPRTAAIAERLWSRQEVRDVPDMYRRLAAISLELEELGLTHRKNQAMLLRRLAAGEDISALQLLTDLVEPVKIYQRYQQRPQSMNSPLTGLVDAAGADAPGAREFNQLVAGMIDDPALAKNSDRIRGISISWSEAGKSLDPLMKRSPALNETAELSRDLRNLGEIVGDAMSLLEKGSGATSGWRDERLKMLDGIAKPKAAVEFQVVASVRKIVNAVFEKQRLK